MRPDPVESAALKWVRANICVNHNHGLAGERECLRQLAKALADL